MSVHNGIEDKRGREKKSQPFSLMQKQKSKIKQTKNLCLSASTEFSSLHTACHVRTVWRLLCQWVTNCTFSLREEACSLLYSLSLTPLTPSLPQPVKHFRAERCRNEPANSTFSGPIMHLFSRLCVLITENPVTLMLVQKRRQKRFEISPHFYWLFCHVTSWQW